MVFQGAQTSIEGSLDTMTSQEIQSFNSQFSSYEGSIKGSSVKSLLQAVIASNGSNTYGRTVQVNSAGCRKNGEAVGTTSLTLNPTSTGSDISGFASQLSTTSTYTVSFGYNNDGTINQVTIAN